MKECRSATLPRLARRSDKSPATPNDRRGRKLLAQVVTNSFRYIYMNELLVGMMVIHQVLPAIMKKLVIDEEEFRLDRSELGLG